MTIAEEYTNQQSWRNWRSYLDMLPVNKKDIILDLGCGTGHVSSILAERSLNVIGIDVDTDLLDEAKKINSKENIGYVNGDLRKIHETKLPLADGIWASFVAAYFPDFSHLLKQWLKLLKPGGWIALVEVNDLFGHLPLSLGSREGFKRFYEVERSRNQYDYEMGSKLNSLLTDEQLSIINDEFKFDKELSFNGPADPQILTAWENRFDRIHALGEFFGKEKYPNIKFEFLESLTKEDHTCNALVRFVIARK
jgi:SAM-dependent methyltransferase